jgi:glycosyltransferase involved in cell wall biosynthesis
MAWMHTYGLTSTLMSEVVIVGLGTIDAARQSAWREHLQDARFVMLKHAAPSGLRLRKRALGIGVDSAVVALKALPRRGPVLALNPWPAAACRKISRVDQLACTGIYAEPGSNSWNLLRRLLGHESAVVAMSEIEARAWQHDGGRAAPAHWGGTFNVPLSRTPTGRPRIFVGGTSDRDSDAVTRLVTEVQSSHEPVQVVIADGSGPREWSSGDRVIHWLPFVPQHTFLAELAASHVSFIPLRDRGRAAGHMVLAASLEAGLPVLATPVSGMTEYLNPAVSRWDGDDPLSPLLELATADKVARAAQHATWRECMSLDAHVRSVVHALSELRWL